MYFFVDVGFWVCMCRSVLGLNFVSVFFGLRCVFVCCTVGCMLILPWGLVAVVCCVYGMVVWCFGSAA